MTRNIASGIAIAAAAIMPGSVFADDITVDTTPFVSTRSRAEVQAELLRWSVPDEWVMQFNQQQQLKSAYARAQARTEYIAERAKVNALNAEDSGSAYLARAPHADERAIMGGPAR